MEGSSSKSSTISTDSLIFRTIDYENISLRYENYLYTCIYTKHRDYSNPFNNESGMYYVIVDID